MTTQTSPTMDKSKELAIISIRYCREIEKAKRPDIADQLGRSSASAGANIREAQFAESRKDFIHKMKIAYKELSETEYWLELCKEGFEIQSDKNPFPIILELKKLLSATIATAKRNQLKTK